MANRIKRSAALFKSSWTVLKLHRPLLLLPVLSSIVTLVVVASFAAPVVTAVMLDGSLRNEISSEIAASEKSNTSTPVSGADESGSTPSGTIPAGGGADPGPSTDQPGLSSVWKATGIVYLLLFYGATTFVVVFFNAALIAAADQHFQGKPSGLRIGLRLAARRLPQILGWAMVAATIGTILQLIAERSGLIGQIVVAIIGVVWSIASYFAVPAVVLEGVGPIKAVKYSAQTIKETWGESLILAVGFRIVGMLVSLVAIAAIVGGGFLIAFGVTADSTGDIALEALGLIICLAGIVTLIAWSILQGTLRGITQTALYRFAKTGEVPDGFDREHLEAAFKTRKSFRMG